MVGAGKARSSWAPLRGKKYFHENLPNERVLDKL
jgi:hypothetical protein